MPLTTPKYQKALEKTRVASPLNLPWGEMAMVLASLMMKHKYYRPYARNLSMMVLNRNINKAQVQEIIDTLSRLESDISEDIDWQLGIALLKMLL